ncbi:hypothetical protein NX059_004042 [Plenodomus lindquistii]|nr:hypothetical protein NX059_004042 [Plenodomus lindquistii]
MQLSSLRQGGDNLLSNAVRFHVLLLGDDRKKFEEGRKKFEDERRHFDEECANEAHAQFAEAHEQVDGDPTTRHRVADVAHDTSPHSDGLSGLISLGPSNEDDYSENVTVLQQPSTHPLPDRVPTQQPQESPSSGTPRGDLDQASGSITYVDRSSEYLDIVLYVNDGEQVNLVDFAELDIGI